MGNNNNKNSEIDGIYEYAKVLKQSSLSEETVTTLPEALARLIKRNLFTKSEIDMMFQQTYMSFQQTLQQTIAQFDENQAKERTAFKEMMANFKQTMSEDRAHHEHEILKLENCFERALNNVMYKIIGTLGGIIVLTGAVASLWHQFG